MTRHWAMSLLTSHMSARVVDYTPLTAPVAPSDVAAWRAQAKASGAPWVTVSTTTIVTIAIGAVAAFFFLSVLGGLTVSVNGISTGNAIGNGIRLVIVGGICALVVVVVVRWQRNGGPWTRRFRLARFAQANGMAYSPAQGNPNYPGMIFGEGRDRQAIDHLDTTSGRFLDIGNYRWVTGSGRSQTTHTWGFLALSLDRRMPNIVLDSRANNTFLGSNLPAVLRRDQVLHLEGDFDRYFTLYCPSDYQQDALYIFTPDLMALLIDEAAPFDVELVDSWMFVYSSRPFTMTDPATLQRLFRIADTVGAKAIDQTERYADERVGDFAADLVAPQGARLKRGVSVVGVVVVVGFLLVWSWGFFGPIIGGVLGR